MASSSSSTSSVSAMSTTHDFSSAKTHLPDITIKLTSNNYLLWKTQVLPILRGHGLLGYVTRDIPCPDSTITGADGTIQQNPAAANWLRMDQLVLGWINSSLSDGPLSQVINCESCHDAWMVLETLYGSHTRDRIQQMKGELQTLSKGSYSLEDYLHKAKSLALSLRGAGKPMDDDDLIVCILRGLGSEFDPIVAALNARDMFPSLEGVIGKLRDFEIMLQNAKTTPSNLAFYTNRYRAHAKSQGNVNMRERTGGYSKNQHQFQGRSRDISNTRSGENSSRNKMSSFTRPNRNSGRGRGGITCFRCGGPNHKADGCFASDDEAAQYKAFAAIQVRDTTDDSWYPDTGANQHMTSNPNEVQGACWSFSATGAIEGINKIVTGSLVSLSEQELIECDKSFNDGCGGGLMDYAFQFVINNHGIDEEEDYPYRARDGTCNKEKMKRLVVTIDKYVDVPENEKQLLQAVAAQPVSVGICGSERAFQMYSKGIFTGPCSTSLDHAVLIVGYGSENGVDYWIVKNSWGTGWGMSGYIHMQRNSGNSQGVCGINMLASYPVKTSPNPPPPPPPGPNKCDLFTYCAAGETCCCARKFFGICISWKCCGLDSAVCCKDRLHCCPHDYPVCDTDKNMCFKRAGNATRMEATEGKTSGKIASWNSLLEAWIQ